MVQKRPPQQMLGCFSFPRFAVVVKFFFVDLETLQGEFLVARLLVVCIVLVLIYSS